MYERDRLIIERSVKSAVVGGLTGVLLFAASIWSGAFPALQDMPRVLSLLATGYFVKGAAVGLVIAAAFPVRRGVSAFAHEDRPVPIRSMMQSRHGE